MGKDVVKEDLSYQLNCLKVSLLGISTTRCIVLPSDLNESYIKIWY